MAHCLRSQISGDRAGSESLPNPVCHPQCQPTAAEDAQAAPERVGATQQSTRDAEDNHAHGGHQHQGYQAPERMEDTVRSTSSMVLGSGALPSTPHQHMRQKLWRFLAIH